MKRNTEKHTSYEISQSHMDNVKESEAKFYFETTIFVITNIEPDPGRKLIDSCSF